MFAAGTKETFIELSSLASKEVADRQALCHQSTIRGSPIDGQASHSKPRRPVTRRFFANDSEAIRLQLVE